MNAFCSFPLASIVIGISMCSDYYCSLRRWLETANVLTSNVWRYLRTDPVVIHDLHSILDYSVKEHLILPLLDYSLIICVCSVLDWVSCANPPTPNALEVCYHPFAPIVASSRVIVAFHATPRRRFRLQSHEPCLHRQYHHPPNELHHPRHHPLLLSRLLLHPRTQHPSTSRSRQIA